MRVTKFLHRVEDLTLVMALVTMLAIALMQIVLRNFYDAGLLWAESFLRVLVLWVAILGAMVATRQSNHISIDVVARYLPMRTRRVTHLLTGLIAGGICGTLAWYSLEFIRFEFEDETIAFASVPSWVCQSILPFGFMVMAFRFVVNAVLVALGRPATE